MLVDWPCAPWLNAPRQDTIAYFRTSATNGLLRSDIPNLLATHGYNEFSVSTPEPVLIKFLKTVYENPLILLLCGSAAVSAIMGNVHDALSITVAVLIVLTGVDLAVYFFVNVSMLMCDVSSRVCPGETV